MVPARQWLVRATRARGVRALAALLAVVTVVSGSAAVLTFQQALDLRSAERAHLLVYPRVSDLIDAVQRERHVSAQLWTADPAVRGPALRTSRLTTDQAWEVVTRTVADQDVDDATDRAWTSRVHDLRLRMAALDRERRLVDTRTPHRARLFAAYSRAADAALAVLRGSPGARLARDRDRYRSLVALRRLRELHGRRVSLVAAAATSGVLTRAERRVLPRFDTAVQSLLVVAGDGLHGAERARFDQVIQSGSLTELARLQAGIVRPEGLRTDPSARTLSARSWVELGAAVDSELRHVEATVGGRLIAASGARSDVLTRRAWLAAGFVVLLVLLAVPGGWLLGSRRVGGLGRGAAATPGEVGPVGVRPAQLELARRVQSLVHRQLGVLDELESRTDEPEQLHRLFELDHLAVTSRRAAEVLAVLAGDQPQRRFSAPVPLVDVVRSAAGETANYAYITVVPFDDRVRLVPHPAVDLTHLLAELLEAVTARTPPDIAVTVTLRRVAEPGPGSVEVMVGVSDWYGDRPDLGPLRAAVREPDGTVPSAPSGDATSVIVRDLARRHGIDVRFPDPSDVRTLLAVRIPAYLLAKGTDAAAPAGTSGTAAVGDADHARRDRQQPPGTVRESQSGTPLPKRVRQANLAPELREDPLPSRPGDPADGSASRTDTEEKSASRPDTEEKSASRPDTEGPSASAGGSTGPSTGLPADAPLERVRSRYTSLQEGLARGRAAAAQAREAPPSAQPADIVPADERPADPAADERPPDPPVTP